MKKIISFYSGYQCYQASLYIHPIFVLFLNKAYGVRTKIYFLTIVCTENIPLYFHLYAPCPELARYWLMMLKDSSQDHTNT